jgi:DNA polymerase V
MLKAMDSLNQKWGRNKIRFAAQGTGDRWQTQQAYRSAKYTTHWDELLKVH